MRPRMYGSTDIQRLATRSSPGPGSGTSTSASSKSPGLGSPCGRAASWISREATGIGASAVDADQGLGHAAGLLSALDLDRDPALDLEATGNFGDLEDLAAAAELSSDGQRCRKANLVQPVVDPHLGVGDVHELAHDRRQQRQREVAVRDRPAERSLLGAVRVDVDELVIVG